jgi:integrase
MLRLERRHGQNYYARGTLFKIRYEQSVGTSDRGQAEKLFVKLQSEIYERNLRGSVCAPEGFARAAVRYMESRGKSRRRFLPPLLLHFGDMPIDQIDQQAINRAATAIYPDGAPATRNRQVYVPVSAILKFARVKWPVQRLKAPEGVVRWLTTDEASRLIAACSPHLRPLVMFLLYTGARAGEALWLDWRCVDLARAHVSFLKTKNGKPRGVPLHRDLVAALANLPHREGELFRRPDGAPYERPRDDYNLSARSKIGTAFQGAVKRAGIENFRVHDCRHTWATWHFREHRDLIALQTLGGWLTLAMVTRYAHANTDNYRDGINALPSLGENSGKQNFRDEKVS